MDPEIAVSAPMLRSYSTDSPKKEWVKRLSLRGTKRAKEVFLS